MNTTTKTMLRSDDLKGPFRAHRIESFLNQLKGIEKATVHFNTSSIEVDYNADKVSARDVREAIRKIDGKAKILDQSPPPVEWPFNRLDINLS